MLMRRLLLVLLFLQFVATRSFSVRTASHWTFALAAKERNGIDKAISPALPVGRRELGAKLLTIPAGVSTPFLFIPDVKASSRVASMREHLCAVSDPSTYSALVYAKPTAKQAKKIPLLVVLHGAGKNEEGVWNLADPNGEHAGLLPTLIDINKAPLAASDHFAMVAPYSFGKRSFYEEPRSKLLRFVDWVCSEEGQKAGCPSNIDSSRIFLFGFSDGATVAVELATTQRFKACVVCAYGYSGILPQLALERLKNIPMWIFHSADDVIFPVSYSDQLVKSLRSVSTTPDLIRYTRYESDQEGFTGNVRGHSVGITASKSADIYTWMLNIT
jgi:predicted peptidase